MIFLLVVLHLPHIKTIGHATDVIEEGLDGVGGGGGLVFTIH